MRFFAGIHHPNKADRVPLAMVSANALKKRRSLFPANEWILDSGAFKTVEKHGGYPEPVETYAALIRRFSTSPGLLVAVAQDYMCEEHILNITGLTVAEHQRLTIERYDALLACDTGGVPVMPVLQGYTIDEYVQHLHDYGDRLTPGMWVGVGSVCKRNRNPGTIAGILEAIHAERPDLLLHGFGIKITALHNERVRELLHSADSMAWSFAARYEGRDPNDVREAVRYSRRVDRQAVQRVLFLAVA